MQIKKKTLLLTVCVLLAVVLAVPPNASGQTSIKPGAVGESPKFFTVVVSRHGFNGTSKPLVLNLTQGDFVHITFLYGDNDLSYDNPHVIFLQGYDLRTNVISRSNPSATLEFIAAQTGSFVFYCVVPCDGMLNLNSGRIVVAPRQAGALQTSIDVMVDGTAVQGRPANIMATLTQESKLVPDARVDFYANTTYGLMKIGTAVTDQSGVARTSYRFVGNGEWTVIAEFAGSESLAPSAEEFKLFVEPRSARAILVSILPSSLGESISSLPYVQGQNRMPDLRLVGVPLMQGVPIITLILLIVGSVWFTYGYVFLQIRAIMRGSPAEEVVEKGGGERKLESTSTKKGFDKRVLTGAFLVVVVVAVGLFAYYQFSAAPQGKTETIKIDIKMLMQSGGERHVFDPATITVHKGDHIVLIVTNTDDDSIHGVTIPEMNLNTGPLTADQQAKLEFDANTTGTFTILCPVPGCAPDHAQMIGQLVVTA